MNEGQVRVGGRTLEIGRLRSWISLSAGVALGAGLAIGVVSAAPNGATSDLIGLPATPPRVGQPDTPRPAMRRPLHQLLFQSAAGQVQRGVSGRFVAGRITEVDASDITVVIPNPPATAGSASGATASTGGDPPIQTRIIRLGLQTRSPAQRPRPGDFLFAIGRPEADGSLTARAVAVRRPGQFVRRQAALTTTRAPAPA